MKRLLFTTMIAACAAMGLSGCISGDYDANPDGTVSGTNPLNPPSSGGGGGGGGTPGIAAKGEIRFRLNGSNVTLKSGKYLDGNPRLMSGGLSTSGGEQQVGFIIDNYTGPGTYTITENDNQARYTLIDYTASPMMKDYLTDVAGGAGEIKVTSDANDEMIGTFSFTAFYNSEKVELTNGSFNLPKQ